jgi:ABC-type transport system substrate-binding protein
LRRWAARDAFGLALMQATDELAAAGDRVVQFRLKKPFPLLPAALGKPGSNMPCIMPERLAATDPFKPVTEMVGSGPYRFLAGERVSGSRVVYEKFADYVPRAGDQPSFTGGPKIAYVDRVIWTVIPDPTTAANALVSGEVDWWEAPLVVSLLISLFASVKIATENFISRTERWSRLRSESTAWIPALWTRATGCCECRSRSSGLPVWSRREFTQRGVRSDDAAHQAPGRL